MSKHHSIYTLHTHWCRPAQYSMVDFNTHGCRPAQYSMIDFNTHGCRPAQYSMVDFNTHGCRPAQYSMIDFNTHGCRPAQYSMVDRLQHPGCRPAQYSMAYTYSSIPYYCNYASFYSVSLSLTNNCKIFMKQISLAHSHIHHAIFCYLASTHAYLCIIHV